MKTLILLFSILSSSTSIHIIHKDDMNSVDLKKDNKVRVFESKLTDYILHYDHESKLVVNTEIWNELLLKYPPETGTPQLDFASYWKISRKEFCDKVKKLDSPEITHLSTTPEKKENNLPQMYNGEVFISHKSGLIKSRFNALEWNNQLYLMNIKTPN